MSQSHIDETYMQQAYDLAKAGYDEGGCPIGAVLVDRKANTVLGQGHNMLVQEGNPIIHGEMAAMRNAGRLQNRHDTVLYTTLQPCFMCAGTIAQFGIPKVVIGDTENAGSDETIVFLKKRGVEIVVLQPDISDAARSCIDLAARFRQEKPKLWLEDWGGGPNPDLA